MSSNNNSSSSSKEWSQFISALESKHVNFEQIKLTSDPRSVIAAVGFTDPLTMALIETQWRQRLQEATSNSSKHSEERGSKGDNYKGSKGNSPLSTKYASKVEGERTKGNTSNEEQLQNEHPQRFSCEREQGATTVTNHNINNNNNSTNKINVSQLELVQSFEECANIEKGSALVVRSRPLPSRIDYTKLSELPNEVQDSIVANEVVMATLGFSGELLSHEPSSNTFIVSSHVPLSMRSLCQTIVPVANAFVRLQEIEHAEYSGHSLIVMALGEVVSEICTSYVEQINDIHSWCTQRPMPLLTVVSEIMRIGHPIIRLRQLLPFDLLVSSASKPNSTFSNNTNNNNNNSSNNINNNLYKDATRLMDSTPLQLQPLSMKKGSMSKYPALAAIGSNTIENTTSNKISFAGPRLLNHLFLEASKCKGSREDDAILTLLLRRAMAPFLRIMFRWMYDGVLDDPLHEFFISENTSLLTFPLVVPLPITSSSSSSPSSLASALFANNANLSAQWSSGTSLSSKQVQQRRLLANLFPDTAFSNASVNKGSLSANSAPLWGNVNQHASAIFERRFVINKYAIPTFLLEPRKIVKMILFAGKYCCLLRECGNGALLPAQELLSVNKILQWSDVESLHGAIEECFERAGSAVIRLLLGPEVNLLAHLSALKTLFLHERGDCITDFLESAESLLDQTCDQVKIHSLAISLQAAIARCFVVNNNNTSNTNTMAHVGSTHHECEISVNVHDLFSCSFADYTLEQYVTRHSTMTTRSSTLQVSGEKSISSKLFSNDANKLRAGNRNSGVIHNDNNNKEEGNHESMPRAEKPFVTSSRSLSSSVLSFSPIREHSVNSIVNSNNNKADRENRASVERSNHRRCVEMLQLEADLQWPLTLVLDSVVMRRFNVIFRLLLWVRACERELCNVWFTNPILAEFNVAYGLKHQFIQFLRQFQFHAVHVVLEPLWEQLILRIKQAQHVFAMTAALHDFFDEVEVGLVLSNEMRYRSLAAILELTTRFCETGNQYNNSNKVATSTINSNISNNNSEVTMPLIDAALQSIEETFAHALSELASPVGSDYSKLLPLLSWIDFNGFYSRHNIYHVQANKMITNNNSTNVPYNNINELSTSTLISSASSGNIFGDKLEDTNEDRNKNNKTTAIASLSLPPALPPESEEISYLRSSPNAIAPQKDTMLGTDRKLKNSNDDSNEQEDDESQYERKETMKKE